MNKRDLPKSMHWAITGAAIIVIAILLWRRGNIWQGNADITVVSTTKASLRSLDEAIWQFKADTGRYPTAAEGLMALIEKPADVEDWPEGGYLKSNKLPKDEWGNYFVYLLTPDMAQPVVISYGADGEPGGEGKNADLRGDEVY